MSKRWTVGPWRAYENGVCWQIDAGKDAVATTQFCYARETEANAHLIAAAPELFGALGDTLSLLLAFVDPQSDAIAGAVVGKAQAVLTKACGEKTP